MGRGWATIWGMRISIMAGPAGGRDSPTHVSDFAATKYYATRIPAADSFGQAKHLMLKGRRR
jgi:hypothetical protein